MVEKFEDWPKNLLLVGLFIVCISAFMSGLGGNYDEDISTPYINVSQIDTQLQSTADKSTAWGDAFKSDNIFASTGVIVLFSIWGVAKLIWDSILTLLTLYLNIITTLFGIPPIVTGIITSLTIISLIFLVWKTIKQG